MNWFEKTYIFSGQNDFKPIFWKRMRDDYLLIWKKCDVEENRKLGSVDLDRFLWKLNCLEKRIEFTMEREIDGYCHLYICSYEEKKTHLSQRVYRKETPKSIFTGGQTTQGL